MEDAASALEDGIDRAALMLEEEGTERPSITADVARILGMTNVPQTRKMACAIIANAMVFHTRIAGTEDGIKQLHQLLRQETPNPQREILDAWKHILRNINYWPIFDVASRIIDALSPDCAARIMRNLEITVSDISAQGIDNSHDLTGRVFQRLIVDRKYLATFYTLPSSAALLARLAVAKIEGVDWSDAEAIGKLRIGDFACGTGALLSAVYDQIAARHERAGGNLAALHPVMMEEVLYGCDVMPLCHPHHRRDPGWSPTRRQIPPVSPVRPPLWEVREGRCGHRLARAVDGIGYVHSAQHARPCAPRGPLR